MPRGESVACGPSRDGRNETFDESAVLTPSGIQEASAGVELLTMLTTLAVAAGQVALTDRALVISPESMPKEMMRAGWIRTMVSSNRSPKALPPDGITAAVPRTSI